MENQVQTDTIYSALARAQATFSKVTKSRSVTVWGTGKNGNRTSYSYRYADLESVLAAVRPSLNREGIYLSQPVAIEEGRLICETVLYWRDATLSAGKIALPVQKGTKNDTQSLGSAITYARRYCLCAALAVAADDDDDGAGAGTETTAQQAQPQAAQQAQPLQAPPPAPEVQPAVRAAGEAAAAAGWRAFAAWWNALPGLDRDALNLAGLTNSLKETAKAATLAQRAAATENAMAAMAQEEPYV